MKRFLLMALLVAIHFMATSAPNSTNDLGINYLNYTNGQVLSLGNIQTAFVLTNYGSNTINSGDTLYLSARFNNKQYGMNLTKVQAATRYVLQKNLGSGDTIVINPGYLIGYQVIQSLPHIKAIPTDTLHLGLVVYGVGAASFDSLAQNTFPWDSNPQNNVSTITFIEQDLGINYTNYSNNQITLNTTLKTQFQITNYGPLSLPAGDTLYLAARINGYLYNLSLTTPNGSTPYILTSTLGIGQSITVTPGNLNGKTTAAYLSSDTAQVSVLVYGVGKASINSNFNQDGNPSNNITSVTYNPKGFGDIGINYLNYTNGQVLSLGNIQTAFVLTNYGRTVINAGDTLYLSARFNNIQYGMDLTNLQSATRYVLKKNIGIGDTIVVNPGYLIGYQVVQSLPYLNATPTDTLHLGLVVYGVGAASFDSLAQNTFPKDTNPKNNIATITFVEQDLGVNFINYSPNQVIKQNTILTPFNLTNFGPNPLPAGDTIYLASRINGKYYDLNLTVPNGSTPYVLTSTLGVGSSITLLQNTSLSGAVTAYYAGSDTAQVSVLVYGVGQVSIDTTFSADGNPNNNLASVTYNPNGYGDIGIKYLNYTNGQVLGIGNIQTAFVITNYGRTVINAGDTLYLSARFNNIQYGMDLTNLQSATRYVLKKNLNIGDTIVVNPGYLIGYQVVQSLPYLNATPTDTLHLGLVVYGVGAASFDSLAQNTFPRDTNPKNNIATITFIEQDLGVKFTNYSPNQVIHQNTILTQFNVTNYGPNPLPAGDTIYLASRVNGKYYDLNLSVPNGSTPYVLTSTLGVGSSITLLQNTSLSGSLTAFYAGADTAQVSVLVFGIGKASIDTTFSADGNPKNNIASVTYNPTLTSLQNQKGTDSFIVYPNPAVSELNFAFSGSAASTIVINDLVGKEVKTVHVQGNIESVNVTDLTGGIYVYSVLYPNGVVKTGKVIIH